MLKFNPSGWIKLLFTVGFTHGYLDLATSWHVKRFIATKCINATTEFKIYIYKINTFRGHFEKNPENRTYIENETSQSKISA